MSAATPSYWCYRCSRFVRVLNDVAVSSSVLCPDCGSGFVEDIDNPTRSDSRRVRRIPAAAMYMIGANNRSDSNPDHTAPSPSGPEDLAGTTATARRSTRSSSSAANLRRCYFERRRSRIRAVLR
ncbi:RING-H2 finger C2A [Prunus dulcis]|uniref:RING-type E3 ubiquitin transferase n=1 Tax=Prunus dulcis TaxID=3755 RepID=A0A4Y1R1L5_PRUDU|nr:RING-H2 finger C2A [Prunus dulcis]